MNHDQHNADAQERQMLEHFRLHSDGEPSAQLDAQILAAAAAATRTAATGEQPAGFSARLHSWLFGSTGRPRWSVALAGLACLGIGVSLTWRTFEQAPDAYDAVPMAAPSAAQVAPPVASSPMTESIAMPDEQLSRAREAQSEPALQSYSADAAKSEKKRSITASVERLSEEQGSDAQRKQQPLADSEVALRKSAESSANQAEQQLSSELQRLLKLRADGWTDEADALLLQLMRSYPDQDVSARLQQLEQTD